MALNIIFNKYFRESVRLAKMQEVISLVQKNMTVAQYKSKFAELTRFARHMV